MQLRQPGFLFMALLILLLAASLTAGMSFRQPKQVSGKGGPPQWAEKKPSGIGSNEFWAKLQQADFGGAFSEIEEHWRSAIIATLMLVGMMLPNYMFRAPVP